MALVIESGSRTIMKMTTPPTGWTKDTSFNDFALRVTTGSVTNRTTGLSFSTVFKNYTNLTCTGPVTIAGTNPTTITNTTNANHVHFILAVGSPANRRVGAPSTPPISVLGPGGVVQPAGGGSAHAHPAGTYAVAPGSPITEGGSPVSLNLNIKYVDVIIAVRS